MSSSLARLFRSLFPAFVTLFALIVLGGAGAYYMTTGNGFTAAVLGIGGLAGLVALFGLVALQIENNELLRRLAAAAELQLRAGRGGQGAAQAQAPAQMLAAAASLTAETPAAPAAGFVAERRGGAMAAPRRPAAPQGRVEPVLTTPRRG